MPCFSGPVVSDTPWVLPTDKGITRALFRHYGTRERGRTVLKTNGVYATVDYPTQDQIDAASEVYLGGHSYVVTQTVADALTAAGYTVTAGVSVYSDLYDDYYLEVC